MRLFLVFPVEPGSSERERFNLDRVDDLTFPEVRILQDATGLPFMAVDPEKHTFKKALVDAEIDAVAALIRVLWKRRIGRLLRFEELELRWSDWDFDVEDDDEAEGQDPLPNLGAGAEPAPVP